tara:strand:- start:3690 stop:4019 length:330 start_codon:yes stop_codon:yes gene_type:complete
MNNSVKQPRKRGKKHALKKARVLQKTPEELLEMRYRKEENSTNYRQVEKSDNVELATEELYSLFCDENNYPLFCYLDYKMVHKFVKKWSTLASTKRATTCDDDGWSQKY